MNLEVIRDCFLEGRDKEGVLLLLESLINSIEVEKEIDNEAAPETYVGVNWHTTVGEGETVSIVIRPQRVFRPNRFVVASSIARSFMIEQIRIGNNIQGVSVQSISAELFSSSRRRFPRILFETAQVAMDITVITTNISPIPTYFKAGFFGLTV